MIKANPKKSFPCKTSALIMICSFFAVICQLAVSLLIFRILLESGNSSEFHYIYSDHVISALSSIALTFGGAYLIDNVSNF